MPSRLHIARSRIVVTLAICAATVIAAGSQTPQRVQATRDVSGAVGTAEIGGLIMTDDQAQTPVRHAKVSVSSVDGQGDHVTYSDDAGKFSVAGLPAGRYAVSASKLTLVRAAYGARRYDRPGTPITLANGERVTAITLKMPRGAVVTGTVTDQNGQPAPGVTVRLNQYRNQSGERTLLPAAFSGGSSTNVTDDRGSYRIFGVPPGDYVVNATPRNSGSGDIRQMSAADLSAAQQAAQQPGASTPITSGDAITVGFAPVFYPGTASSANAVTITLTAGEERSGIDIPIQLVRTSRIDGIVVTPNGVPPQSVQLLMVPSGAGIPMQMSLSRVVPDAQGKFAYTGITPGQYTITARASARGDGSGAGAASRPIGVAGLGGGTDGALTLWAMADVTASGQPISGVTLTLQPGMTVTGSVQVDAKGADAPNDLSRTRISLAPGGGPSGIILGVPNAQVDAAGKLTLTGVTPGKYRVTASLSSPEANWVLKSAISHGRDALDFPLEVLPNQDVSDLIVTFTNQTQEVSGTLQDASGRPAPDFTIVIFPADKTLWPATRRIKTTRPGTDGRFVVTGLPTGDYRIAAVTDMAPGDQNDPAFLEQLLAASFAFPLREGEKKIQDLKLGGG